MKNKYLYIALSVLTYVFVFIGLAGREAYCKNHTMDFDICMSSASEYIIENVAIVGSYILAFPLGIILSFINNDSFNFYFAHTALVNFIIYYYTFKWIKRYFTNNKNT
jgi:hypothetical protein